MNFFTAMKEKQPEPNRAKITLVSSWTNAWNIAPKKKKKKAQNDEHFCVDEHLVAKQTEIPMANSSVSTVNECPSLPIQQSRPRAVQNKWWNLLA